MNAARDTPREPDYESLLRAVELWKASIHGRTQRGKTRKGCNLTKIYGCIPCRVLAGMELR